MSALDTEAPAWEMSKENAAPRKKGRDVAKLNRAFGAAPDDDAADASSAGAPLRAADWYQDDDDDAEIPPERQLPSDFMW